MTVSQEYPIGTPGQAWGEDERQAWLDAQSIQRSYQQEVLDTFQTIDAALLQEQYGALSYDQERYPLFAFRSRDWRSGKPAALITGGVHGYETSGVQGAVRFMQGPVLDYLNTFNVIVAPCISPWAYETINRWNPRAIDPNRSFVIDGKAEESAALIRYVQSFDTRIIVHIDLHETTDTDNSEFRPALAARDNVEHKEWAIPDGFYLVGDTEKPVPDFQAHIIEAVRKVTHIAPADDSGRIIGELTTQDGVINYATKALGLCAGFSNADYCTTTEVYPDSPLVDDENCIQAQVAAVTSGLDYVRQQAID